MKPAVLKLAVYPFGISARVKKIAVGEFAFHKNYLFEYEASALEILFPVGFHLEFLLFPKTDAPQVRMAPKPDAKQFVC